ncbi:uncharacterized protein LOC108739233 [Agrilus planipennis]|uniref:Uncharacterized protein LOC108739233 n=1 Tax=Agrilus planipennis TaxID=224129 RepID=A0A1W4WXD1_AGRPL|nr:uncharacterized protein LOC108739233 [Agrilus planipennis]
MSQSESEDTGSNTSSSTTSDADWPVTEEWLQAVLKQHHKDLEEPSSITVVDFAVRPGCDARDNVLSDILAVSVKYKLQGNDDIHSLNFIIKLLPQDPFSRFFVTEAQFDLREISFYTQIVPDLESFQSKYISEGCAPITLPIPNCYYAHYAAGSTQPEPTPPESVLVLENIKSLGFHGGEISRGLTLRQVRAAVEAISKIHALSLCLKIKEEKQIPERYPFLFQTSKATDSYQHLVERGLPQLDQFLERRQGLECVLDCLHSIRPKTKDIIENLLSPQEPMGLITHTDFWCNNLMFKEDEDNCECTILDWQMVTFSRPTNDLALLIISSVPTELRRQHTETLLDNYWDSFTAICQKLGLDVPGELEYDRKKLGQDYRRSQLLALLLCIGSVDVALGDPLTEERLVELLKDLYADGILANSDEV